MSSRFRSLAIACGLAAACFGGAVAGPSLAAGLAPHTAAADSPSATASQIPPNSITVNGSGDVNVVPDMAVVTFGVLVNGDTALDAQNAANTVIDAAVKNLHALGIPNRQIQTASISLQPRYDNSGNTIIGYQATQTLAVTVYGLRLIGKVVDAGVSAHANNNVSISYALRNEASARTAALKLAVQTAAGRAQAAAAAVGRSLAGAHIQITESSTSTPKPVVESLARAPVASGDAVTPPTQSFGGLLNVHEDVTVTYTF
jgi:uncharacterized protein YggE